jgi:hypothetical protein
MPSVIDAPVRSDRDAHDLQDEQPKVRIARAGFWHRLVQSVRRRRIHTSSRTQSSARRARHPMESPLACEAPEPRTLYLLGFWGLHNG